MTSMVEIVISVKQTHRQLDRQRTYHHYDRLSVNVAWVCDFAGMIEHNTRICYWKPHSKFDGSLWNKVKFNKETSLNKLQYFTKITSVNKTPHRRKKIDIKRIDHTMYIKGTKSWFGKLLKELLIKCFAFLKIIIFFVLMLCDNTSYAVHAWHINM